MRFLVLLIASVVAAPAVAGSWHWQAEPTFESSKELFALLDRIQSPTLGEKAGVAIQDVTIEVQDFKLVLKSGVVAFEPDIDGAPGGAWFTGEALMSFTPQNRRAKITMQRYFGKDLLTDVPIQQAYIRGFGRAPLQAPGPDSPNIPPSGLDQYADVKSALKQRGLDGLRLFLNAEGRSKGAFEVVFPMSSLRVPGGEESLLRYVWDPGERYAVAFELFGHPRMTDHPEWKYIFRGIVSEKARDLEFRPEAVVSEYETKMKISPKGDENKETAILHLTLNEGTKSLLLDFTLALKVTSVVDDKGRAVAFAQWKEGAHSWDSSLLVKLPDDAVAGTPTTLTLESEGALFKSWFGWFSMATEDNWIPKVREAPPSLYSVAATASKRYTVVGAGVIESQKEEGDERTTMFRTPLPTHFCSLHFGELTSAKATADETSIEAFSNNVSVEESKAREFVATEVANAVKVYDRIYGPVGLPTLRVVSTPTAHGRGFQGIILIGQAFNDSSSFVDIYRAHEVAHQWWGNIAMLEDWTEDRWLGESFAEYSAMEFYQVRYQDRKKTLQQMDLYWISPMIDPVTDKWKLMDNTEVSQQCANCYPIALGGQNVYSKGPMVLHMLRAFIRKRTGSDALFWDILRTFLKEHAHQYVTTDDFLKLVDRKLGTKMDWFWEQWLYRSETPIVRWSWSTAQEGGQWKLKLDAKQENADFRLLIPATVTLTNGQAGSVDLEMFGKTAHLEVVLPLEPKKVDLNASRDCLVKLIRD